MPQGNTSIPKVHHPNAFAMYFKNKLWNTAFPLIQGMKISAACYWTTWRDHAALEPLFKRCGTRILIPGRGTLESPGGFQNVLMFGPHPRPTESISLGVFEEFPRWFWCILRLRKQKLVWAFIHARVCVFLLMLVLNVDYVHAQYPKRNLRHGKSWNSLFTWPWTTYWGLDFLTFKMECTGLSLFQEVREI